MIEYFSGKVDDKKPNGRCFAAEVRHPGRTRTASEILNYESFNLDYTVRRCAPLQPETTVFQTTAAF